MIRTPEKDEMAVVLKVTDFGYLENILFKEMNRKYAEGSDAQRLEMLWREIRDQRQSEIQTRRRIDREMNEELNKGLGIAVLFG